MSVAGPIPPDMSMRNERYKLAHLAGILSKLRRDRRGNVLAITAAVILPLAGMVGGGLDLGRMYLVKTRLQHACDAGALAGRKAMGGGTWAQSSYTPRTTANQFFDGNYATGAYGSQNLNRSFSESAGKVSGSASVDVPMTLMKIFNQSTRTMSVTCDAEMRLPNTDVMFVLDVTGSMSSSASPGDPPKIETLKDSVKCFYEIVARLDTDAECIGGAPSGGTGNQVQIRFGFMPYSTNVNVGRLLPTSYFANRWNYQSREARWWVYRTDSPAPKTNQVSAQNVPQDQCNDKAADQAGYNQGSTTYSNNNMTKTVVSRQTKVNSWTKTGNGPNGTCSGTQTETTRIYDLKWGPDVVPTANDEFNDWHYGNVTQDISSLKNGTGWRSAASLRLDDKGVAKSVGWDGCIEERATVQQASYTPIPAGANDLNIDMVPSQSNAATLWGPALQAAVYQRGITVKNSDSTAGTRNDVMLAETNDPGIQYRNPPSYFCPTEARRLQAWPAAAAFDNYVDSLVPEGNTYHDIGMLWGARFMSPTGIFAADNATTPQGGEILRHMIFMTDGDAVAQPCDYTAYGMAWWDRRTTNDVGTKSNCNGYNNGYTALNNQVNARLDALCTAVKNMNITLWVISFGNGSNAATEKRLDDCASDNRYFSAKNSAELQTAFKNIADQISQLRLTK